jgi:molybdenum cofactor synthesis domain-containing protein
VIPIQYSLLGKTELRMTDVRLEHCDLALLAKTVASVLQLPPDRVFVIDVRDDHVALDLLVDTLEDEQFVGKKDELLQAVGSLPGVVLGPNPDVHSDGVLGMIALPATEARSVMERSARMGGEVLQRVGRRMKVFPTGFEVAGGMIEDTNTPFLVARFSDLGFTVHTAPPLGDDVDEIAGALRDAVDAGYGWIVTTGGVGAEDKDCTVEALLKVCPDAATPYIMTFERGHGRHVKDGIRIGVGRCGLSYLVTLPGPHEEVKLCAEVLARALPSPPDVAALAEEIADVLRKRWLAWRTGHRGHPA